MTTPPRAPGVTVEEVSFQPTASATVSGSPPEVEGNSDDYRYIQVRRALIYIEQSLKEALDPFVFASNTPATWTSVVSAVNAALQQMWSEGKLAGATPEQAFRVACGLGSTMTAQDVSDGNLVVRVDLLGLQPEPAVLTVQLTLGGA
jgi:hypothetical protein